MQAIYLTNFRDQRFNRRELLGAKSAGAKVARATRHDCFGDAILAAG
jgi:hypothetical protein